MKINTLAAIACIVLLSISEGFAQHSLEVDDGHGHYTTLLGGNPGGTLTLPSGNGILLLSYSGTSSVAWLTSGNSGTTPTSDPLTFNLTSNSFLGTTDNKELDFVTNGAIRARFKESTGDTNTAGAFEPGLGNTYSLGSLNRPWNHLYVSGATITFTNSTGVHGARDGGQSAAAISIGNLSFDSASSTFNFDHPLNFAPGGTVTTTSVTITGLTSPNGGLIKADPTGILGLADTINDYQTPLSFSNGLTKIARNVTLGGALGSNVTFTGAGNVAMSGTGTLTVASIGTGVVKSTAGLLGLATPGADFENPLTFSNGLTRTVNAIKLGGALGSDATFTGSGNIAMTGTGTLKVGALAGVAKFSAGLLGLATPGADFENPLTFSNGLTRTVNAITLGGALGSDATFTGSGNIAMTGTGTLKVGALAGVAKFSAGLLGLATPGTDFENPLTFSNGLTRTVNAITLGGALASNVSFTGASSISIASLGTGLVKATAGLLVPATAGTDFENPLTFSNGLTRTTNAITLGGALGSNVSFTGAGNIAMNGTGTLTVASIGTGVVKSTSGLLGLATPGTDFENPLTFSNGLTRTTNAITLGGALGSNVSFTGSGNIAMSGTGTLTVASIGTGVVKSTSGLLGLANPGTDFENPLTFSNGLTRTSNAVALGGAITGPTTFTGTGDVAFNETGTFTIGSLGSGLVISNSGTLAIAQAGLDYQTPLSFSNGLSLLSGAVTLGGALTGNTSFTGYGDVSFNESGNFIIGSLNGGGLVISNSGTLAIAQAGIDYQAPLVAGVNYQTPLSFSNGLSLLSGAVTLGGALTGNTSFTGYGDVSFNESGNFIIGSLNSGGLVISNSGTLSIAQAGTDYQAALTAGDGISTSDFSSNKISLGGTFSQDVIIDEQTYSLSLSNTSNSNALSVSTSGSGWAGSFTSASGNGLYVSAASGQTGLQVNSGSVILSHTDQPTGAFAVGAGTNAVLAIDDAGAVGAFNITLNPGTNGQIIYIYNGDAVNTATLINATPTSGFHPKNLGPTTITPGQTIMLIYVTNTTGSGWVTK